MEEYFDIAWEYIYLFIQKGVAVLDYLLSYLHFLGPVPVIVLLAVLTVALTKVLKKYIRTKRLETLEKDFQYWLSIREEAMQCEDRDKGKALAKNIDSAKLNKAYYDYFLEGLLLSFITFYLPIISMASYINEAYRSERLFELFGRDYMCRFGNDDPVVFGALFCFLISIVSIVIVSWIVKRFLKGRRSTGRKICLACKENQSENRTACQSDHAVKGLEICSN